MLKSKKSSFIKNENGMAVFEVIPIIIVIVLLVNFSLGFFGAIHSGILNSIAARNYTFETFRNRSNLVYFKNTDASASTVQIEFSKMHMRVHGIGTEKLVGKKPEFNATTRLIDFLNSEKRAAEVVGNEKSNHNKINGLPDGRNQNIGANPIWIKTSYGICLDARCGS